MQLLNSTGCGMKAKVGYGAPAKMISHRARMTSPMYCCSRWPALPSCCCASAPSAAAAPLLAFPLLPTPRSVVRAACSDAGKTGMHLYPASPTGCKIDGREQLQHGAKHAALLAMNECRLRLDVWIAARKDHGTLRCNIAYVEPGHVASNGRCRVKCYRRARASKSDAQEWRPQHLLSQGTVPAHTG